MYLQSCVLKQKTKRIVLTEQILRMSAVHVAFRETASVAPPEDKTVCVQHVWGLQRC